MKHLLFSSFAILVLFASCSKTTDDAVVTPTVAAADTISSGWSKQQLLAGESFTDIVFLNNSTGYVLGGGSMFKTVDGGISWNRLPGFTGTNGANLAVTADNKIFAMSGSGPVINRSADGGTTFSNISLSAFGIANDAFFLDNNSGYSLAAGALIKTIDGGLTWNAVTPATGLILPGGSVYNTGWFFANSSAIVASGTNLFKSNGSLNSWTSVTLQGVPANGLISIFALSPSVIFVGVTGGKIYQSTDGGSTFTLKATISPGNSGGYLDLHFIDSSNGYACYGNRIYKTTDGGNTWQVAVALATSTFSEIHFTDATHGWGCGNNGVVLKLN